MKPWKRIKNEVLFENPFAKLDMVLFEFPDGRRSDYFIHGNTLPVASILPLDESKNVIMAREFRPGPEKILDELPGGLADEGEDIYEAAARELLEETGCQGDLKLVLKTYLSAYSPKVKYCFVATNCKFVQETNHDDHEFIEVVVKSLEDFKKQLRSGELTDLETGYAGLHYLGL